MENYITVTMNETIGHKNTEEYKLELKQKETIDTKEEMNATICEIKHPEALYTKPLFSEINNILSLINPIKKQEKLEVKQSIIWKKFKSTSFDGTK